jgi:hypothetical protein
MDVKHHHVSVCGKRAFVSTHEIGLVSLGVMGQNLMLNMVRNDSRSLPTTARRKRRTNYDPGWPQENRANTKIN